MGFSSSGLSCTAAPPPLCLFPRQGWSFQRFVRSAPLARHHAPHVLALEGLCYSQLMTAQYVTNSNSISNSMEVMAPLPLRGSSKFEHGGKASSGRRLPTAIRGNNMKNLAVALIE